VQPLPTRLLLAVSPRLLADVLLCALRSLGTDITLHCAEDGTAELDHYDLALISDVMPPAVAADLVVRLREGSAAAAVLRSGGQGEPLEAAGIEGLLELVRACMHSVQAQAGSSPA